MSKQTDNWRSPKGKREAIEILYPHGAVPSYQWFAVGSELEKAEMKRLWELAKATMFDSTGSGFGDIEWHSSDTPAIKGWTVLRVRNANVLKLTLEGDAYPLYQVGNCNGGSEHPVINFTELEISTPAAAPAG